MKKASFIVKARDYGVEHGSALLFARQRELGEAEGTTAASRGWWSPQHLNVSTHLPGQVLGLDRAI
jgi:hypothetical protein